MTKSNEKVTVAIAGLLLAAALTGPAFSQDGKEPTTRTTEIRTVIHDGPNTKGATWSDGQEMKVDCPGELTVIEASAGVSPEKKEKAKMVFCSMSGDKAEAAAGLETALAGVEADTQMDAALRAAVSAKLKARIAELRASN